MVVPVRQDAAAKLQLAQDNAQLAVDQALARHQSALQEGVKARLETYALEQEVAGLKKYKKAYKSTSIPHLK